jgi:hypothetical protein
MGALWVCVYPSPRNADLVLVENSLLRTRFENSL